MKSDDELMWFFLWCVAADNGKNAKSASAFASKIISDRPPHIPALEWAMGVHDLPRCYETTKAMQKLDDLKKLHSNFAVIENTLKMKLNLRNSYREEFVKAGMSYKGASYFLLYSRPDAIYSVLSKEVLEWIRINWYAHINIREGLIPTETPKSRNEYLKWEEVVLRMGRVYFRGCSAREIDEMIMCSINNRLI